MDILIYGRAFYSMVWAVLLFNSTVDTQAQAWCPPGAFWDRGFASAGLGGYSSHTYSGDTILMGEVAQKIDLAFTYTLMPDTNFLPANMLTKYVDDIVYLWHHASSSWDTLFWFGASIGDTWQRPHDNCIYTGHYEVIAIQEVVIEGITLKRLTLGQSVFSTYIYYTLYERIGLCPHYTFPDFCFMENSVNSPNIYRDDEILVELGGSNYCDLSTSVEVSSISNSTVFPNPGTDHFNLLLTTSPNELQLFDALGRRVLRTIVNSDQAVIDTRALPAGLYHIRIINVTGSITTQKWLKE